MNKQYCKDCGKPINNRSIRCRSCETKRRHKKGIINSKKFDNPSCIDGRTFKKYYCECGKEISYESIRKGTKKCQQCYLKTIKGKNHPLFGKHHTKKTKRKIKQALLGLMLLDKNPNWKNGKSFEPYSLEWTEELKNFIRQRDNYICQKCGKEGNNVHHIDYDKENCTKENLITLCTGCNSKVNFNRDYWYSYFTYLMEYTNEE